MAAEGNVSVNNIVQTIVQYPTFREMINSILAATYQEQSCFIASAKIPDREGSISPSTFYEQLSAY